MIGGVQVGSRSRRSIGWVEAHGLAFIIGVLLVANIVEFGAKRARA